MHPLLDIIAYACLAGIVLLGVVAFIIAMAALWGERDDSSNY